MGVWENGRSLLHVKTVSRHNSFMLSKIFKNGSHLISCPQCNRLSTIELGIIPIHFRQS